MFIACVWYVLVAVMCPFKKTTQAKKKKKKVDNDFSFKYQKLIAFTGAKQFLEEYFLSSQKSSS